MTDPSPYTPRFALPGGGADAAGAAPIWALVPCAGRGERAGGDSPKQYRTVAGRPLVLHTLDALLATSRIGHVLVLLAPHDAVFATLAWPRCGRCSSIAHGGPTRAATVQRGLAALRALGAQDRDWVLVHDAARCLVTPELVDRLIDACAGDAVGGLLAQPVSDTLKLADGGRASSTLDRSRHWMAQTPQMFRVGTLQRALEQAGIGVTDEASAIEALGLAPRLVPGDASNFKVTTAQDFLLAQAVLRARADPHHKDLDYDYP